MVSIGRTGRATPFAVLEPVFVGGSTVGVATLHNEDQVRGQGRPPGRHGDRAQGGRRHPGGRRPGPVVAARGRRALGLPDRRARARSRSTLVRAEGEADTRCVEPACPFQRDQRIIHFGSRGAMDIEGLGERTVMLLSELGLVKDAADIYSLQPSDLLGPGGLGRGQRRQPARRHRGLEGPAAAPAPDRARHQAPRAGGGRRRWPGGSARSTPSWAPARPTWPRRSGVGPVIAASITPLVRGGRQPGHGRAPAGGRGRLRPRRGEPAGAGAGGQGRRGHRHARGLQPGGGRGGHQGPRRQEPGERQRQDASPSSSGGSPGPAR